MNLRRNKSLSQTGYFEKASARKLFKTGVVNFKQKVESKIADRKSHHGFNVRNKARQREGFRRFCTNLLAERKFSDEKLIQLSRLVHFSNFQEFLEHEPEWVPKLNQWILSASKRISWEQKKQARKNSQPEKQPSA